jgi:2-C-methyl-D-erythritol 4-phosphate cytidylyltransferase / 2-C-methyl-D-erythritol 2,4-cyclodiphosphate synthase
MRAEKMTACAIIVAGGRGTRARTGDGPPKQLVMLGGKPVLAWSIDAFTKDPRFSHVIVVCPNEMESIVSTFETSKPLIFAPSGPSRTASVRSGLGVAAKLSVDVIFIHDAARPGLDPRTLDNLFDKLHAGADGCVPIQQVPDALWHIDQIGLTHARDKSDLVRVQTPQAFQAKVILEAYGRLPDDAERSDDVAVAREAGFAIVGVAGSPQLDKITWSEDFDRMQGLLQTPMLPRTGSGYDAHRFGSGDYVTLCGQQIAHTHGLAGHSDADVGWHALADAIYGALSAGDIGQHFPPSDGRWKGAPSSIFLKHAGDMVLASGGLINHLDLTLICEAPKIGPHRIALVQSTSDVLGLRIDQISIKATTTEGMGFTGRGEGIAAQATATIMLPTAFRQAQSVDPAR